MQVRLDTLPFPSHFLQALVGTLKFPIYPVETLRQFVTLAL
jgi:hypothetical protein